MVSSNQEPKHSFFNWESQLRKHWGIQGTLALLSGEFDLNFLATTSDGQEFIFKVMRPGCETWLVDMQCAALQHIRDAEPDIPTPYVISADNGQWFKELADESGQTRIAWVTSKLDGQCYRYCAPKSAALIKKLGEILGTITSTLSNFQHPGLNRDFKWNLIQADWISSKIDRIESTEHQTQLKTICEEFENIKPTLAKLPSQAIHNDANDDNILISGVLNEPRLVSGIIDFGDMYAAPRICDLAIAAAYCVLDHANPQEALASLVSGFHSANPLTVEEIDLIWPLLRMRLAVGSPPAMSGLRAHGSTVRSGQKIALRIGWGNRTVLSRFSLHFQ